MENAEIIKAHKFEIAKQQIKSLSEKVPQNVSLPQVATNGTIIPWHNHNVTGTELNNVISHVQSAFIQSNTRIREIYKEFHKIYNAFDTLDKEYIQAILVSLNAAKTSSEQAKAAQEDINKTVQLLKASLIAQNKFKDLINDRLSNISNQTIVDNDKSTFDITGFIVNINDKISEIESNISSFRVIQSYFESCLHMADIDLMWDKIEANATNITDTHIKINELITRINTLTESTNSTLSSLQKDIVVLSDYRSYLESFQHLKDIDTIWNNIQEHTDSLTKLQNHLITFTEDTNSTLSSLQKDILVLSDYQSYLESFQHLKDIDTIWSDTDSHKTHLSQIEEQLKVMKDNFNNSLQLLSQNIEQVKESNNQEHQIFDKKIKIAYAIGFTVACLSIVQLVLQIVGVL